MALLETAADRRETLLRQIYEINRQTVESGRVGNVTAIVIRPGDQHDAREAAHLVDRLEVGGVEVFRATAPFVHEGRAYDTGTLVCHVAVFAVPRISRKRVYRFRTDNNVGALRRDRLRWDHSSALT
jgi:hypothetical protein